MNQWKYIWNAYHENTTTRELFKNVIALSTRREKIILFVFTIMFLVGVVMLLIPASSESSLYFLASLCFVGLGELVLIYQIEKLRQGFIRYEFGDVNQLQTPHDDKDHKITRYLMFKKILKDNGVTNNHIQDCQELIDLQIDMASSKGLLRKNFSSFVGGLFVAFLASLWAKFEIIGFVYTGFSLIIVFSLVYFVLYLIPSKLDKLKEMKYFMLLYKREF